MIQKDYVKGHISHGLVDGEDATIFSIQKALDLHCEFLMKFDQLLAKHLNPVIVFDFSQVEKVEGAHIGLPLSVVRSLEHMGHKVYVLHNDNSRAYFRHRRLFDAFTEIKADRVTYKATCAA